MKSIVVFQHVAHEILGTFHPLLRGAGFRIRYVNFERAPTATVSMERYGGLIVLGGPMGVYEASVYPHLGEEIRCIREAIGADKPVLGICLGAQLIAAALGAEVAPSAEKEIGWYEVSRTEEGRGDPLLEQLSETETLFQWHQDAYELPAGATWLARSKACPQQAFRYGAKVYGFQFHLEADEPMIHRWLTIARGRGQLDPPGGRMAEERIRGDTTRYVERQEALSRRVFSHYLDLFSTKRRKLVLRSRGV